MLLIPDDLVASLSGGRAIAYLGSGFSAPVGMPGWPKLLKTLLDLADVERLHLPHTERAQSETIVKAARAALDKAQLPYCASLIRQLLTKSQIRDAVVNTYSLDVLRSASQDQRDRMKKRARSLFKIPLLGLITTNYDTVIEHLISLYSPKSFDFVKGSGARLGDILCCSSQNRPFFFKIHGSLDDENIVLDTEEYSRTYLSNTSIYRFLQASMLASTFMFIGASLEDEIIRLRRDLFIAYNGTIPTSYAIVAATPDSIGRAAWLHNNVGIRSIFYDNRRGDHTGADRLLDALAESACVRSMIVRGVGISETIRGFLKDNVRVRTNSIGPKNITILRFLNSQPGRRIDHDSLLRILEYPSSLDGYDFTVMSSDEVIYRIMFLIQISLIVEDKDLAGRIFYILPKEASIHLN